MADAKELDMDMTAEAYSAISYMNESYCDDKNNRIPDEMLACRKYGIAAKEATLCHVDRPEYLDAWEKGGSISVTAAWVAAHEAFYSGVRGEAEALVTDIILSLTSQPVLNKAGISEYEYNGVVTGIALYATKRIVRDMSLIVLNEAILDVDTYEEEGLHATIAQAEKYMKTSMEDTIRGIDLDYLDWGYRRVIEAIKCIKCDEPIANEWRKEAVRAFKNQSAFDSGLDECSHMQEIFCGEIMVRLMGAVPIDKLAEYSAWRAAIDIHAYAPDDISMIQALSSKPSILDCPSIAM